MKIITNPNVVMFDVDRTLIEPYEEHKHSLSDKITISTPSGNEDFVELKHVTRILKRQHVQQHFIVVWSQGGDYWATVVLKALNLQDYVDLVITKPKWYHDDVDANEFMTRSIP